LVTPGYNQNHTSNLGGLSFILFYFIQLTHADIMFFDFFNNFLGKGKPEDPEHFSKFPKLEEHYKQVRDFPGIKAWLEKRPKTDL